jgi:hypothetical protein
MPGRCNYSCSKLRIQNTAECIYFQPCSRRSLCINKWKGRCTRTKVHRYMHNIDLCIYVHLHSLRKHKVVWWINVCTLLAKLCVFASILLKSKRYIYRKRAACYVHIYLWIWHKYFYKCIRAIGINSCLCLHEGDSLTRWAHSKPLVVNAQGHHNNSIFPAGDSAFFRFFATFMKAPLRSCDSGAASLTKSEDNRNRERVHYWNLVK